MALAALIEAIFVIMGKTDTAIRQCPLAMDKWVEMVAGPIQTMLGLVHDTNELTVAIPGPCVCELHNLIDKTWQKLLIINNEGGATTHRKTGSPSQGSAMGFPPPDPPICIYCTYTGQEQTTPAGIVIPSAQDSSSA